MFKKGPIDGVIVKPIKKFVDDRGWLAELFREDELPSRTLMPVMSYLSITLPGIVRGPHEHVEQTDYFSFIGPSNFKLVMWDNRKGSSTFGNRMVLFVGEDNPTSVIIPEGVVHAYKNVGTRDGVVMNFPNRLFMGDGKKSQIDEIRHEDNPNSAFKVDEI